MSTLGIIVSSSRPNRVGSSVAQWVRDNIPAGHEVDLIDFAELTLPSFDEPDSPKSGAAKTTAHGQEWAERVAALDALVILTPQYNGSYPGSLKNAVDWLYAEWQQLPVIIVGYGWGDAAEVISHLEPLMVRVGADVVTSIGLGFRDDLSIEGEMFVREDRTAALSEALTAALSKVTAAA